MPVPPLQLCTTLRDCRGWRELSACVRCRYVIHLGSGLRKGSDDYIAFGVASWATGLLICRQNLHSAGIPASAAYSNAWRLSPSAPRIRRISQHPSCQIRAGSSFLSCTDTNLSIRPQPAIRPSGHHSHTPSAAAFAADTASHTALSRECTARRQKSKLYTECNTRMLVASFKLTNTLAWEKPLTPGCAFRLPSRRRRPQDGKCLI